MRKYDLDIENIDLTEKTLRNFDCVLLLTDHDEFPYELIKNNSNLIIDTRGRFNLSDNHSNFKTLPPMSISLRLQKLLQTAICASRGIPIKLPF